MKIGDVAASCTFLGWKMQPLDSKRTHVNRHGCTLAKQPAGRLAKNLSPIYNQFVGNTDWKRKWLNACHEIFPLHIACLSAIQIG